MRFRHKTSLLRSMPSSFAQDGLLPQLPSNFFMLYFNDFTTTCKHIFCLETPKRMGEKNSHNSKRYHNVLSHNVVCKCFKLYNKIYLKIIADNFRTDILSPSICKKLCEQPSFQHLPDLQGCKISSPHQNLATSS